MSASSPARLAFAATALAILGFAPAAQAATVLANVAGTIVSAVVANKLLKGKIRSANCRLYDRDGREVYLPCDADRPLGDVVHADASPPYAPQSYAPQSYARAYPVEDACGCLAGGGYGDAYGARYEGYGYQSAYGYRSGYGGEFVHGGGYVGQGSYGFPYNGAPVVSHVAGRDAAGFLTWAGKRAR